MSITIMSMGNIKIYNKINVKLYKKKPSLENYVDFAFKIIILF